MKPVSSGKQRKKEPAIAEKRSHAAPRRKPSDEPRKKTAASGEAPAADGTAPRPRCAPSSGTKRRKTPPKGAAARKRRRRVKKSHPVLAAVLIILAVLILAGAGAVGYSVYKVSLLDTVFPGTVVEGVDLGGMTRRQAAERLLELGSEKYDGLTVTAKLPLDNELTISAWDAGLTFSTDKAAEAAWRYGRDGSSLANALSWFKASALRSNTFVYDGEVLEVTLDEDAVRSIVAGAAKDIDEQLLESGLEYGANEIRIVKGASGLTIDEEEVVSRFVTALLAGDRSGFTYESDPETDNHFDFQALYDEIHAEKAEAQLLYARDYGIQVERNAAIIANLDPEPEAEEDEDGNKTYPPLPEGFDFNGKPYGVTRSRVGVSFDVAAAQADWDAATYGQTVIVPLEIDEPEHTTEEIESLLFADVLSKNWTMVRLKLIPEMIGEARTSSAGSTKQRINNLRKACGLLNGIELMPGDLFSYNLALGERTPEAGWQPAPAYANNEVRQEYGGGICQVSSTLYNAVLYSNLMINSRDCHQFKVGYLPAGMDATVSWGAPDFRFINNKDYPIRIVAWFDEDTQEVCVQIRGTDVDHQYVIVKFNSFYLDADEKMVSSRKEASFEGAWIGRFVYNDGDDYTTATPIGGGPNYEAWSKYGFHEE